MRTAGSNIYPYRLSRLLSILEEAGMIVSIASRRRVQIAPDPAQDYGAVLQCTPGGR